MASFREKPELSLAKEYVESGKFLWNAGYFMWKTETILDELKKRLNITYELLTKLNARGEKAFKP